MLGQLGAVAILEEEHDEAEARYTEAQAIYRHLNEPAGEAVALHQLGRIAQARRQPVEAEDYYRRSARLKVRGGDGVGAAVTWNQIANLHTKAGRLRVAEQWYRKALRKFVTAKDEYNAAMCLKNLASVLRFQSNRLGQAKATAQRALKIKLTLDPRMSEIWTTYNILARIAESESSTCKVPTRGSALRAEAQNHRDNARCARRAFPGTKASFRRFGPLIRQAVAACNGDEKARESIVSEQAIMRHDVPEAARFVDAFDALLAGARDRDAICSPLDSEDSMLVELILAGIADPRSLQEFA